MKIKDRKKIEKTIENILEVGDINHLELINIVRTIDARLTLENNKTLLKK